MTLNFGEIKTIAQFALTFKNKWTYQDEYKPEGERSQEGYQLPEAHSYKIEISMDGINYETYAIVTDEVRSVYVHDITINCQYVRLTVEAGDDIVELQDFKAMGCNVL